MNGNCDRHTYFGVNRKHSYFSLFTNTKEQTNLLCDAGASSVNYTLWVKKTIHVTFDDNFGKCRPIYKLLSPADSWKDFTHTRHKDAPICLKCVSTLPCETCKIQLLPISMTYCMWDLRIHLARYEAALIA